MVDWGRAITTGSAVFTLCFLIAFEDFCSLGGSLGKDFDFDFDFALFVFFVGVVVLLVGVVARFLADSSLLLMLLTSVMP